MDEADIIKAVVKALESPEAEAAIKKAVKNTVHEMSRNVDNLFGIIEAVSAARFVLDNMSLSLAKQHYYLRTDAIVAAPPEGLFIEFGVWEGFWLNQLARAFPDKTFYGFDSFEGLPEQWSIRPKGYFSLGGKLPEVEKNIRLVKGYFDRSLPVFLAEHPDEKISFIHMDCDLYTSTMTALTLIRDRLQVGTQIVLDDFMLEPGWATQEHKAFMDFCKAARIEFSYTGYSNQDPSVSASVVLTKV